MVWLSCVAWACVAYTLQGRTMAIGLARAQLSRCECQTATQDEKTRLRSPAALNRPGDAKPVSLGKAGGRRESRMLAAPAVSCAKRENAHENTGSTGATRP